MAFVLLAGVTGLLWPKSDIQAEDTQAEDAIVPCPVRTLSFREGSPPVGLMRRGLPTWLDGTPSAPPPSWTRAQRWPLGALDDGAARLVDRHRIRPRYGGGRPAAAREAEG